MRERRAHTPARLARAVRPAILPRHAAPRAATTSKLQKNIFLTLPIAPHVQVEQKDDGQRWRGDFTSRYIEDITTKTGNFKAGPAARTLAPWQLD